MMEIRRLWLGELPLADAFWRHGVVYALLVNLLTSLLFYVLVLHDAPIALSVFALILPFPYNAFIFIAVWRSAARDQVAPATADRYRVALVIWMILLMAT